MEGTLDKIIKNHAPADKYKYMLLDRMKTDCNYFLGYGHRSPKVLWGLSVEEHIADMKKLYCSFPKDARPEWLTLEDIEDYEKRMKEGDNV